MAFSTSLVAGLVVLFYCMVTVSSHVCIVNPHQRGSMENLNTPGAADCVLTEGPCGGRSMGSYLVLKGESNYTVIFQKNLDHWDKSTPGYFSISFSSDEGKTFTEAARVEDTSTPSLHLYSVDVTLPAASKSSPHVILQVLYITKNPEAPPAFYQCADLILY